MKYIVVNCGFEHRKSGVVGFVIWVIELAASVLLKAQLQRSNFREIRPFDRRVGIGFFLLYNSRILPTSWDGLVSRYGLLSSLSFKSRFLRAN
jgi:hypothetical protein